MERDVELRLQGVEKRLSAVEQTVRKLHDRAIGEDAVAKERGRHGHVFDSWWTRILGLTMVALEAIAIILAARGGR